MRLLYHFPAMPIDPDTLAKSVARLEGIDPVDAGLDAALELAVAETDDVFGVDGAGLMLLSEDGVLRYVVASDEPGRMLEALQEQFGEGPCVDAFLDDKPVLGDNVATDPRWPSVGPLAAATGSGPSSASPSTSARGRSAPSTSTPSGRTSGTRPTSPPSRPTPG